ncbi:hypothetical protein LguiA_031574 [Lonicera macranthoides]
MSKSCFTSPSPLHIRSSISSNCKNKRSSSRPQQGESRTFFSSASLLLWHLYRDFLFLFLLFSTEYVSSFLL